MISLALLNALEVVSKTAYLVSRALLYAGLMLRVTFCYQYFSPRRLTPELSLHFKHYSLRVEPQVEDEEGVSK